MSAATVFRMVFAERSYAILAMVIAGLIWIIFNIFDGLILLVPLNFYYPIPGDAFPGFILSCITAALVGIIVSINVYLFKNYRATVTKKALVPGSTLGTLSSMCIGCSSIGFYFATTFGTAGVAASTLLANLQFPLRLVAIGLLVWAYYSAYRKITKSCRVS